VGFDQERLALGQEIHLVIAAEAQAAQRIESFDV
jgi:hypothetical protein